MTLTVVSDDGEIVTETGERCRHLGERRYSGCTVYSERPRACTSFRCMWLMGFGERDDRPNQLGLIVEPIDPEFGITIVSECWPAAVKGKRAQFLLAALSRQAHVAVMRRNGEIQVSSEEAFEALCQILERIANESNLGSLSGMFGPFSQEEIREKLSADGFAELTTSD